MQTDHSPEGDEGASLPQGYTITSFPRTGRPWVLRSARGTLRTFDYGCALLATDGFLALVRLDDGRQLYIHLSEFVETKTDGTAGPKATRKRTPATSKQDRLSIVLATLDALGAAPR